MCLSRWSRGNTLHLCSPDASAAVHGTAARLPVLCEMWVWSAQSHVFRGALVEHVTIKGSTYKSKTR